MNLKQLYFNNLSYPNWCYTSDKNNLNTSTVAVWRIEIAAFIIRLELFKSLISVPELEKAMRYKQKNDWQTRIISKAVLRILLGRYTKTNPKEIGFSTDQNKKPCLENNDFKQLHFNISHSGNWILIVIADTPVGVDLERMNASFTDQNMLDYSFSPDEISFINQSKLPHLSFYKLWTRKEALLKATGQGLINELNKVPSLDGLYPIPTIVKSEKNWQITSFNIDEEHVGSVAFYPVKTALQFFNFQL